MLNSETKRHIDKARDVLVGVAPSPMTQVDLITTALIYKFMDDMDQQSIKLGGKPSFFVGDIEKYSWNKLMDPKLDNQGKVNLYQEALTKLPEASNLPTLFREIFKDTYLPFRNVNTFKLFIDEIDYFDYSHPEELGNAFEYLLTILGVSGDAGMFRTPRHIIDFIVKVVDPNKDDRILDPACGTAGFLIQAYKHIISKHDGLNDPEGKEEPLTTEEIKNLTNNIEGYDISPEMVKLSSVNLYLHDFKNPKISEYDTLSSDEKWNERFDVTLANPPFMTPRGGIIPHNRFSIQATKSEVLFVDYILTHLKHNGRAGIVVPEGIIFQSGNAYKELRKKLLNEGLFGVVSLPSGVFNPYSGVKTSILLIDKELAKSKDEVLFIKISNDGFDLGAQRREINKNDLPEALEIISKWKKGEKFESKSANYVSKKSIFDSQDFNLSPERYSKNSVLSSNFDLVPLFELVTSISGNGKIKNTFSTENKSNLFPAFSASGQDIFSESFDYDEDGIVVSAVGARCGKCFFASGKWSAIANTHVLIKKSNRINLRYLFLLLNDENFWIKGGVAQPFVKVKDTLDKVIPVPPIEIQEQIVEELDRYQKIIEGAKLITENWKPRIEIDPSWRRVKLGKITDRVTKGTTPTTNGFKFQESGINFVKIESIDENGDFIVNKFAHINQECYESLKRSQLKENDILFSIAGALGRAALVDSSIVPANTNQALAIISPKKELDSKYLFQVLKSDLIQNQIFGLKVGVAQSNLSLAQVSDFEIPLPSLEIQKQIVKKIENEKKLVDSSKDLVEIYEKRIKEKIESLWKK